MYGAIKGVNKKSALVENSNHITQKEQELIEHYLERTLSTEDQLLFDEKNANDPAWNQKIEETRLLILGINEQLLEDRLVDFHAVIKPSQKAEARVVHTKWSKRIVIAASFILAIALLSWLLLFRKTKEEQLFAKYYKPDPGLPTLMAVSDNYEFDNAMVNYKMGEYQKAITAWEKLLITNPGNDTLNYFIGSALMAEKKPKEAATFFKPVVETNNSAFLEEANWYLGLAYLKMGDKEVAINYLKKSKNQQQNNLLQRLIEDK